MITFSLQGVTRRIRGDVFGSGNAHVQVSYYIKSAIDPRAHWAADSYGTCSVQLVFRGKSYKFNMIDPCVAAMLNEKLKLISEGCY